MAHHEQRDAGRLGEPAKTLHLVAELLRDIQNTQEAMEAIERYANHSLTQMRRHAQLLALPEVFLKAYQDINEILDSLRKSRSALEDNTVVKIHRTNEKLREVSSTTEVAATELLDGLDRVQNWLDQMERMDGQGEEAAALREKIRQETHVMIGCLQFQDITSQQLNYASSVLEDIERRLASVVQIFAAVIHETGLSEEDEGAAPTGPVTFDPAATTEQSELRQSIADEVFPD